MTQLVIADRVKETSTTTGTGAFTLSGATTGFVAFSSACSVADTCYYCIQAVDATNLPTGEWEVGLGTYSGANTLTRTTVLASSNANAAVSFTAGGKQVSLVQPAAQVKWAKERLTANRTYYVATTGSDSNSGLSGSPFLTIQYALDFVSKNIDCNGYEITISVADGTYAENVAMPLVAGAKRLYLIGSSIDNTKILPPSGKCITTELQNNPCVLYVSTMHLYAVSSAQLSAANRASLMFFAISFGGNSSTLGTALQASNGGVITAYSAAACKINGSLWSFVNATTGGQIYLGSVPFTVTAASAFTAFANSTLGSYIQSAGCTWSGSAITGNRYAVASNAIISVGGSATYFPGSVAGTTATGGIYI